MMDWIMRHPAETGLIVLASGHALGILLALAMDRRGRPTG